MMAKHCGHICSKQKDCKREYYSIAIKGQFERSVDFMHQDHLHGIFIYLPAGLNTQYLHKPRLHLIEYFCYFASVFSLWFGFSIITISRALINAYHYYKDYKAREEDIHLTPIDGKRNI